MHALLVLYDSACPFCARCREWLEARAQIVPLVFLCCRSPDARTRYGSIEGLGRDLVVVDGAGRYWSGPAAFVMCLWALASFRWAAALCASDLLWPLARPFFDWVSASRARLSDFFGTPCTGERCGFPTLGSPYR